MKNTKFIVFLMSMMLVLSIITFVNADEVIKSVDYSYIVKDNEAVIVKYSGSEKDISIPSDLDGYPVVEIGESAFFACFADSVIIPEGVNTLGKESFSCSNLKKIVLPDSLKTIDELAFSNCHELVELSIPEGVEKIGQSVFFCCSKLDSITLPSTLIEFDKNAIYGSCIENIYVAQGNKYYTAVDGCLYNKDMSIFLNCASYKKGMVIIPDGVSEIADSAFSSCFDFEAVVIPDSVVKIGSYAFCFSNNLKDIYYAGSESQWKSIEIGETNENDTLKLAKMHYNYEYKEPEYMLGSLDGNENIDAADALIVLKHSAKLEIIDESLQVYADVNYDKNINATDALEILKHSAKIIDRFPYRVEEGMELLKSFILENGTNDSEGNIVYEFKIKDMIEEELEAIDDPDLKELLSLINLASNIEYIKSTDSFKFNYAIYMDGGSNSITLTFDENNTVAVESMEIVIEEPELSMSYLIESKSEFQNSIINNNFEFDQDIVISGDILDYMTEDELIQYEEEMKPAIDLQIHAGLIMLNELLNDCSEIGLKDLGFINYNPSAENLLNSIL